MFRIFMIIYGLSLTEAYTIKVSGKVELGNQLSKLFKDLYAQLAENGVIPPEMLESGHEEVVYYNPNPENHNEEKYQNDEGSEENTQKKHKKHKRIEKETESQREIPILDKMMKNDLEKLHLYGYHKFQEKKPGEPLNNINL